MSVILYRQRHLVSVFFSFRRTSSSVTIIAYNGMTPLPPLFRYADFSRRATTQPTDRLEED